VASSIVSKVAHSAHYSIVTITGVMNGTTQVDNTFTLETPAEKGMLVVVVTGDVAAAALNVLMFLSGLGLIAGDGDFLAQALVNSTPTTTKVLVVDLQEAIGAAGMRHLFPNGTYTFGIDSNNAGSAGAFTATLVLKH